MVFFFKEERKKKKEMELLYGPAIPDMNTKECLKVIKTGQGGKGADSSSEFWVTWQPWRPSKCAERKVVTVYREDTNIFGSFCRNKLKYLAFSPEADGHQPFLSRGLKATIPIQPHPRPPAPPRNGEGRPSAWGRGKGGIPEYSRIQTL